MHSLEKKLVIQNSIKLVIGIILLYFSYMYLEYHEAEKASILSGFKIMYQKIEVIAYKFIGKDSQLLDEKYRLEKFYEEMINTLKQSKCLDSQSIDTIEQKTQLLQAESVESFRINYALYNNFAYERDEKIKKDCLKQ